MPKSNFQYGFFVFKKSEKMITRKEMAVMVALVAATYGTTARVEQRNIHKAFVQAMADMKEEL